MDLGRRDRTRQGDLPEDIRMESFMRPFRSKDLFRTKKAEKKISRKRIINIINHLNFTENEVLCRLKNPASEDEYVLRLKPGPCSGDTVSFEIREGVHIDFSGYEPTHFMIDNGQSVILFPAEIVSVQGESFLAKIPDHASVTRQRHAKRLYPQSQSIIVDLNADTFILSGVLENFNHKALRIKVESAFPAELAALERSSEFRMTLKKDGDVIFSGECVFLSWNESEKYLLVGLKTHHRPLMTPRKLRNPRLKLTPMPRIVFKHPLSGRECMYDLKDIGTSGFSIEEQEADAQLIPGFFIKEVTILFSGGFRLTCSAGIVYSRPLPRKKILHGFSIVDMDMASYCRLFDVVSNAYDSRSTMTSEINMDNLWDFFFESGFIYPNKYSFLQPHKEQFKETYRKLYRECTEIFTSIIFQKNGKIYGHNCTIRAYQRSWMIHHLAALSRGARQIGLEIMKQSHYYYDGMYRIPSLGMDYMIIYYRPENKFPDYFFGGVYNHIHNPKACSMDLFAYLHLNKSSSQGPAPDGQWELAPCTAEDHRKLRAHYEKISGGLMLDMFGVDQHYGEESIEDTYKRLGLKRRCTAYALRNYGLMKAAFFVDEADMGTNLSELLNNIKVIVMDPQGLPWEVLQEMIMRLGRAYETDTVTVMIHPFEYVTDNGISYDKKYYLWILSSQFGDVYVDYIKGLLRFNALKYIKFLMKRLVQKK